MSNVELPIYVIAIGDVFLSDRRTPPNTPPNTLTVWGTEQAAREAVNKEARRRGVPASLFRICQYRFSGRVMEG